MSKAFRTPEILRLFALKQPEQLRERLATLTRDRRLGKVADAAHDAEAVEILTALKKLGGELSEVRRFDPRAPLSLTRPPSRARVSIPAPTPTPRLAPFAHHSFRLAHDATHSLAIVAASAAGGEDFPARSHDLRAGGVREGGGGGVSAAGLARGTRRMREG